MPDEFAELREALIKFNQAVKFPPQTPNIVFGIIRETEKLLAAYDRVVRERDALANLMVGYSAQGYWFNRITNESFTTRSSAIAALLKEDGK